MSVWEAPAAYLAHHAELADGDEPLPVPTKSGSDGYAASSDDARVHGHGASDAARAAEADHASPRGEVDDDAGSPRGEVDDDAGVSPEVLRSLADAVASEVQHENGTQAGTGCDAARRLHLCQLTGPHMPFLTSPHLTHTYCPHPFPSTFFSFRQKKSILSLRRSRLEIRRRHFPLPGRPPTLPRSSLLMHPCRLPAPHLPPTWSSACHKPRPLRLPQLSMQSTRNPRWSVFPCCTPTMLFVLRRVISSPARLTSGCACSHCQMLKCDRHPPFSFLARGLATPTKHVNASVAGVAPQRLALDQHQGACVLDLSFVCDGLKTKILGCVGRGGAPPCVVCVCLRGTPHWWQHGLCDVRRATRDARSMVVVQTCWTTQDQVPDQAWLERASWVEAGRTEFVKVRRAPSVLCCPPLRPLPWPQRCCVPPWVSVCLVLGAVWCALN